MQKTKSELLSEIEIIRADILKNPHHYTAEKLAADLKRGGNVKGHIVTLAVLLKFDVRILLSFMGDQTAGAMECLRWLNYLEDEA